MERTGTVEANGVSFHFIERGTGPLALCLHGFPDHAPSWRKLMAALAKAGFRAVAPYMRGYAPSGMPADGAFQSAALGADAAALLDALAGEDAVVIGHDWGAVAAYGAALLRPERIRRLVTLAVPYGRGLGAAFVTNPAQQRRSWYMFFFQMPFAEAALAHDDFAMVERLWRDWSPGFVPDATAMAALKATFRQPGVAAAALAYYRHTFQPQLRIAAHEALQARLGTEPIRVPALYLHGEDDCCLGVELATGNEALFPAGLARHIVPGTGHFLHVERPDLVNPLVLDFVRG
jgi:pimeloyl-ACP methyl ester carboxylesterase